MGEIADMMLDGTMDPETGEFNFDGEDGPGFPVLGRDAHLYRPNRQRANPSRTPITNHAKHAARWAMAASCPLGKKRRRWLEASAVGAGSGLYAGVLPEQAPGVLRDLERMGFVRLVEPHNDAHKARYVITDAGRAKLAEPPALTRGEAS